MMGMLDYRNLQAPRNQQRNEILDQRGLAASRVGCETEDFQEMRNFRGYAMGLKWLICRQTQL